MGKCTAQSVNFQGEEFRLECDLDEHSDHRHYFVETTRDNEGKRVIYGIEWWEVVGNATVPDSQ